MQHPSKIPNNHNLLLYLTDFQPHFARNNLRFLVQTKIMPYLCALRSGKIVPKPQQEKA